ncbi:glycosyltransferase family 2 protein [Flavobacterium alkalisoli]|uniref:glycosyltransferase family 2 protein n=1 Tax=Flavobacterium alkalisoli TaxID=2602769 RepID=UPI003A936750
MQLSVIILNYNVRYFLEQCVLSVQKALKDIDGEIIVVDNNSPDDSCAMMNQRFPEVTLIENKDNAGFPKGNNIGVAAAKGEYICILNPDTVVAEDTFKKVLQFAKSKTNLGIVGVKLVDGRGNFLPESKRGVPTPWVAFTKITALNKAFSKSSLFNKYYVQHLSEDQTGEVDILVGAFMVMKRELYLEVGGFDEGCFMYSDDIDLSYTVQQKGKVNYYFHETTVVHYKGESTVKDGTYMNRFREAMQFFYKKHFRNSPVFDLFMRAGTLFFALAKQKKKVAVIVPDSYILLSYNEDLRIALEVSLEKKVDRHEKDFEKLLISQSISGLKRFEVIFDNEMLDFFEIIKLMELFKKSGLTFKIKPRGSNFIIGSNDSNDRGTVIVIKS